MEELLSKIQLNEDDYVNLLRKLIGISEKLQNAPSLGLIPEENLASDFVLEVLDPYTTKNGGYISINRIEYIPKRGNVILRYRHPMANESNSKKTLAFIGSHLDVVPANPETWERDPFTLTVEGDKLYGRGTTDCLGHVALLTQFFLALAKDKIPLETEVVAVFIASEESGEIPGVGVEHLREMGELDFIKNGPVVWVDSADNQPCIGTAGAVTWTLKAHGKLFHSGIPNLGINSLELGMDALTKIQAKFYEEFGPLPQEEIYNFMCPSTMKPTRVESSVNSLNQIPPWTLFSGDIRLAPFYDMDDLRKKLNAYVAELNANIASLEGNRGPVSHYELPLTDEKGSLEFEIDSHCFEGIACSLDSVGYKALTKAMKDVNGTCKPYSISGSLPLVRDLQRAGFDLILVGFGLSTVYHGDNEYCRISDMKKAIQILSRTVMYVEQVNK